MGEDYQGPPWAELHAEHGGGYGVAGSPPCFLATRSLERQKDSCTNNPGEGRLGYAIITECCVNMGGGG